MLYDDENYEISAYTEINDILAELPFDLLKESILEQIDDPVSTNTDYVDTIVEKCRLYKEQFADNEDVCSQIDEALTDFFIFVIHEIDVRFDIGVDLNNLATYKSIAEIGVCIYNYFILRYNKNVSKFITNYIMANRKELVDYYSDRNKKDVTTLSYKKQVKDPADLTLIVNLPDIISYVVSLDPDTFDFVSKSVGANNYDGSVIKGLISANKINGNFVNKYMQIITDTHEHVKDEIQSDIRTRLFKKIKKSS